MDAQKNITYEAGENSVDVGRLLGDSLKDGDIPIWKINRLENGKIVHYGQVHVFDREPTLRNRILHFLNEPIPQIAEPLEATGARPSQYCQGKEVFNVKQHVQAVEDALRASNQTVYDCTSKLEAAEKQIALMKEQLAKSERERLEASARACVHEHKVLSLLDERKTLRSRIKQAADQWENLMVPTSPWREWLDWARSWLYLSDPRNEKELSGMKFPGVDCPDPKQDKPRPKLINLDERRSGILLNVERISEEELPSVDLRTVNVGDCMEGVGTLHDFGVIGFLHHIGRLGYRLTKE